MATDTQTAFSYTSDELRAISWLNDGSNRAAILDILGVAKDSDIADFNGGFACMVARGYLTVADDSFQLSGPGSVALGLLADATAWTTIAAAHTDAAVGAYEVISAPGRRAVVNYGWLGVSQIAFVDETAPHQDSVAELLRGISAQQPAVVIVQHHDLADSSARVVRAEGGEATVRLHRRDEPVARADLGAALMGVGDEDSGWRLIGDGDMTDFASWVAFTVGASAPTASHEQTEA